MLRSFLTAIGLLLFITCVSNGQNQPETAKKGELEGSKAGDRKELESGIFFRWCPPGSFTMGEDKVTAEVTFSSGFWLGETEVTQEQWQKVMNTTPWTGTGTKFVTKGPDYPAMYVSYDDAVEFIKKLTAQAHESGTLPKSWTYSLPTEAQWEYACRAGTTTKSSFGDDLSEIAAYAWVQSNTYDRGEKYAHQVGQKKENTWGLKDMHGNLFEWCSDWQGPTLAGKVDTKGPATGVKRVLRGGGWGNSPNPTRSAARLGTAPTARDYAVGFRLAAVRSAD